MKLDEIVAWYQKKIGTYDKQQWEKTVEQKILHGFASFTLKNAKLKTDFIDVDLVRGSTFPKAKPKQSLLTVIRLAIIRYFFLPIYAKWWVSQTSPKIFVFLLLLYTTQMINWAVYSFNIHKIEIDTEHIVSLSELLIPMALSLILSLIHSQIVATNSWNGTSTKHKHVCSSSGKPRVRRRKKLARMRSQDQDLSQSSAFSNRSTNLRAEIPIFKNNTVHTSQSKSSIQLVTASASNGEKSADNKKEYLNISEDSNGLNFKKRNVNWDSPIHNYANDVKVEICSKQVSEASPKSKTVRIDESVQEFYEDLMQQADNNLNVDQHLEAEEFVQPANEAIEQTVDDDGFESFNGKSSSGEENHLTNQGHIKVENIQCHTNVPPFRNHLRLRLPGRNNNCAKIANENKLDKIEGFELNKIGAYRRKIPLSSESDIDRTQKSSNEILQKKSTSLAKRSNESSETDEEGDDGETISSPASLNNANYTECTTSGTEWLGVTTNSEECSYSSELENSDFNQHNFSDNEGFDHDFTPTVILNPYGASDRINCTIWDLHEVKKAEMSVLDISSCIIERVEGMPETCDYIYLGVVFTIILSLIPSFCRLCEATVDSENSTEINYLEVPLLLWEKASFSFITILHFAFGETKWERTVLIIGFTQRLCLTFLLFFLFSVAERTFKQKFLYAKLFSHLTSSRRARKSDLPHFRLNKVRNIKTWLSVRSYLKRRGPQRSVDVIVSAAFIVTLLLLAFLSVEWLKDSVHLHSQLNLEALLWSSAMGIFLLRFMTLGNKINRKYRSISVLITEQINLYLQIEQKPKKKEELMVSNSVLKLAGDLLKELESPFKISGLSANPYLYTTIKVVILSALSGVLSEMLGFKLKLHKIKIK